MIEQLIQHVKLNETATYAVAFSTIMPVVYMAPRYLAMAATKTMEWLTYEVEIPYFDQSYHLVNKWLGENTDKIWMSNSQRLVLGKKAAPHEDEEKTDMVRFTPSYTTSFIKDKRSPWIHFSRQKQNTQQNSASAHGDTDTIFFKTWIWNRNKLRRFLADVQREHISSNNLIYRSRGEWFAVVGKTQKAHSVILPPGGQEVLDDAKRFLSERQWYVDRGLRYKRSYLLHGEPGTGKSSLIMNIAHELGMPIRIISPQHLMLNGIDLFDDVPAGSIIVIEEIDLCGAPKRQEKRQKFPSRRASVRTVIPDSDSEDTTAMEKHSLNDLLNALDGIASFKDSIVFATTNHLDRLDQALTREGRFDVVQEIGLSTTQVADLFRVFYDIPESQPVVFKGKPISIAKAQSVMLKYIREPDKAAKELKIEY